MSTPHDPSPELAALLRLKRHERPHPEYFEEFVHAFRDRQRAELLRVSAWRLLADRVGTHFQDWKFLLQPRWLVPLGATYAVLMIALFFRPAKPTSAAEVARAREAASGSLRPVAVVPVVPAPARPPSQRLGTPVSTQVPELAPGLANGLRRTPGDALVPVAPSASDASSSQADHGKTIILVR